MSLSVLITLDLVNDFIGPFAEGQPRPRVHIGDDEARRILGERPEDGPLARFLRACGAPAGSRLKVVHLRDWHASDDPEFARYGTHCVEDSRGAAFVWEPWLPAREDGNVFLVNARKLNVFAEGVLPGLLRWLVHREDISTVRFGVIGVATDLMVRHVCEGLQSYLGATQVAVCSELCASLSLEAHFRGLEDLAMKLGVEVHDRIADFQDWLAMPVEARVARPRPYDAPAVEGARSVAPEDLDVLQDLCRGSKAIRLEPLSGGFSGSRVLLVHRTSRSGAAQSLAVAKLDDPSKVSKERRGHLLAKGLLGPNVPEVIACSYGEGRAGLLYSLATMRKPPVRTLKACLEARPDAGEVDAIWDEVFQVLRDLYVNVRTEAANPFVKNTFRPEYAQHTLERLAEVLKCDVSGPVTVYGAGATLPPPGRFYDLLPLRLASAAAPMRLSVAHGDLNLANLLLDRVRNVWVIDFFHAREDHYLLQDVAKLENDLKFISAQIGPGDLGAFLGMERTLLAQPDLSAPLPDLDLPAGMRTAWQSIRRLRAFASRDLGETDPLPYRVAQLRYAAHTLGFDEPDEMQKRAAAISVLLLCDWLASR
ncbi:MAG: phosphotransferase [Planctomycetota bacterium]